MENVAIEPAVSGLYTNSRTCICVLRLAGSYFQCSNGKKEEPEGSVSERRRHEARRRRRGVVSMQLGNMGAREYQYTEYSKLPQRFRAERGGQTTFDAFLV